MSMTCFSIHINLYRERSISCDASLYLPSFSFHIKYFCDGFSTLSVYHMIAVTSYIHLSSRVFIMVWWFSKRPTNQPTDDIQHDKTVKSVCAFRCWHYHARYREQTKINQTHFSSRKSEPVSFYLHIVLFWILIIIGVLVISLFVLQITIDVSKMVWSRFRLLPSFSFHFLSNSF